MEAWVNALWKGSPDEPQSVGPLSKHSYFAFVESMDPFSGVQDGEIPPDWLKSIESDRKKDALDGPHWLVWLDCVKADLFAKLEWRSMPWNPRNESQLEIRKSQIRRMSGEILRVAILLLSDKEKDEDSARAQFAEAAWHRITMGPNLAGIPAVADEDFDLTNGVRENVMHFGECSEGERSSLVQVFNLDFIVDADFDDEEGGDSGPDKPQGPNKSPLDIVEWKPSRGIYDPYERR